MMRMWVVGMRVVGVRRMAVGRMCMRIVEMADAAAAAAAQFAPLLFRDWRQACDLAVLVDILELASALIGIQSFF